MPFIINLDIFTYKLISTLYLHCVIFILQLPGVLRADLSPAAEAGVHHEVASLQLVRGVCPRRVHHQGLRDGGGLLRTHAAQDRHQRQDDDAELHGDLVAQHRHPVPGQHHHPVRLAARHPQQANMSTMFDDIRRFCISKYEDFVNLNILNNYSEKSCLHPKNFFTDKQAVLTAY